MTRRQKCLNRILLTLNISILSRDEDPDPDPLIFGKPDSVHFSLDPDPDPTCNNGFMKLLSSWNKILTRINKFKHKMMFIISYFMPTYPKYEYIFLLHFDLRSDPDFFPAEPDPNPYPWKKCRILIPDYGTCICLERSRDSKNVVANQRLISRADIRRFGALGLAGYQNFNITILTK